MNNEFQWRNQMRKLSGTVEPTHDLWPGIAARLAVSGAHTTPRHRRRHRWMAIAASLVIASGATFTAYQLQYRQGSASVAPQLPVPATVAAKNDLPRSALDWAKPADPALTHATQTLDNASAQLEQALEQRPDAVFLVGLLNRTNGQRMRLLRQAPYAG